MAHSCHLYQSSSARNEPTLLVNVRGRQRLRLMSFPTAFANTSSPASMLLRAARACFERKEQLSPQSHRLLDSTTSSGSNLVLSRLDADPLDVVIQTKRFMDVCLQIRTQQSGEDPAFVLAQRKANLFEESIGQKVVSPQDVKLEVENPAPTNK
ncbi:hypothetical protein IE4803_CH02590 [Rhizobium etli bv. phaseoli str. IE4803]|nr:hypothetical protein IE4803_CH02590 [Rhizobium etli bv. phaseoli str. IE4803]